MGQIHAHGKNKEFRAVFIEAVQRRILDAVKHNDGIFLQK